ncbi:plasmid pRiA4b ORF-3 family protein [Caldalkalibacillus thermarum TA2.A1]|uniref:Plasmid pRiA4b ORF-3 family protein n=1 Tax=Caldalkalibacillus thermarum (strain TA2.A1) TaxID=986075 RepID=F5LAX0_CALTT|nr:plasmid pRiA4b ORF-3 family protein [Caldalkalibacillus thermarum]EGL81509.1 plasmid pRiA4b ORF-3 family protein [Caldalkalibacillus thermarum TA2.A1]QZT33809.1 plasmid pRiA4b ORF-3 family protein [Caldalkalibacillus thermarum TA2.A1]
MIYELKIRLKGSRPPAWCRILVDRDITFAQLHHIMQLIIDPDDIHLHQFEVPHIPESKREQFEGKSGEHADSLFGSFSPFGDKVLIGDQNIKGIDLFGQTLVLDEEQEKLGEWLQHVGDTCVYTYDFGLELQYVLEVKAILEPQREKVYPCCIKANWLPAQDKVANQQWQEELNRIFAKRQKGLNSPQFLQQRTQMSPDSTFQDRATQTVEMNEQDVIWRQLFEAANQYKALAPWQWMSDVDNFAIVDGQTGQTGYCCVLGEGGNVYGFVILLGNEGLRSLIMMQHELDSDVDMLHLQQGVLVSFDNREELSEFDYRLIKRLGLKYRGRHQWPVFRNYTPGFVPWYINEDDARFMTRVLHQAINVCQRVKEHPVLLDTTKNTMFARLSVKEGESWIWQDGTVDVSRTLAELEDDYHQQLFQRAEGHMDHLSWQRVRKSYQRQKHELICHVDYMPAPVQDRKGERPYFPTMCLFLDSRSGSPISITLANHDDEIEKLYTELRKLIDHLGYIPAVIQVQSDKAYAYLQPVCQLLRIKLEKRYLPVLLEIKSLIEQGFSQSLN